MTTERSGSAVDTALPRPLTPACPDGGIPAGALPGDYPASLGSVSIVLACRDDDAVLAAAIRNAAEAAALTSEAYEIIVVDDGSRDDSVAIAARFAEAEPRVRLLVHSEPRGLGQAWRSGIQEAELDWVLLAHADGGIDLRELQDCVSLAADADVIWGWRILRRGDLVDRAGDALFNRLVRAALRIPVRDVHCPFKLIRRDLLARIELDSSRAAIDTQLAMRVAAAGARIVEMGVHHQAAVTATGHRLRRAVRQLPEAHIFNRTQAGAGT